jgi:hypothetical protein
MGGTLRKGNGRNIVNRTARGGGWEERKGSSRCDKYEKYRAKNRQTVKVLQHTNLSIGFYAKGNAVMGKFDPREHSDDALEAMAHIV